MLVLELKNIKKEYKTKKGNDKSIKRYKFICRKRRIYFYYGRKWKWKNNTFERNINFG